MTTTVRRVGRGWLVAALVVAVAVLLGSVLAVAAWSGAFRQGAADTARAGSDAGITQFWHGHRTGPGMMGENRRSETPDERRSDCLELMDRGEGG